MKNKFVIIALFLVTLMQSQTIPYATAIEEDYSNGNYIKDTGGLLNPFVGIWVWENATHTAKMTIKYVKIEMYDCNGMSDYKEDILMGGYRYEENGVVITDKLTFATDHYTNPNIGPIISNLIKGTGFSSISIQITDVAKRKILRGKMKLNSNPNLPSLDPLTATMHLVPQKGWVNGTLYPDKVSLPGNTFPFDMVFTKQ